MLIDSGIKTNINKHLESVNFNFIIFQGCFLIVNFNYVYKYQGNPFSLPFSCFYNEINDEHDMKTTSANKHLCMIPRWPAFQFGYGVIDDVCNEKAPPTAECRNLDSKRYSFEFFF